MAICKGLTNKPSVSFYRTSMASQNKLEKVERERKLEQVGIDAFKILGQVRKKEKRLYQSKPPVQGTQPKKNDAVIDSDQAAQTYGGVLIEGYPSIDSSQAARAYGGVLIGGYDSYKAAQTYGHGAQIGYCRSRPKPTRWAF